MFTFAVPNTDNVQVGIDIAEVPAEIRTKMLQGAVKTYILGRANVANVRYNKLKAEYDKARADDPTGDHKAPEAPDLIALVSAAKTDLLAGTIRERGTGEGKTRQPKDPLDKAVTGVVVTALFAARKAADPKYSYLTAVKEVGASGIAFLKAQIDAKVENGADRAELEKSMETRYMAPARKMVGVDKTGKPVAADVDIF